MTIVDRRVRQLVDRRRACDSNPDDRFRGLYVGSDDLDRLLRERPHDAATVDQNGLAAEWLELDAAARAAEAGGAVLRLRSLARAFGLDELDIRILLTALAPELDPTYERLYGYLNDDVTQRRASVAIALDVAGTPWTGTGRSRLSSLGPLVDGGLIVVDDPHRPLLTRALRVPDRVAAHLLDDDTPDPCVAALLTGTVLFEALDTTAMERALTASAIIYAHEPPGAAGRSWAATALARIGRLPLSLDFGRLRHDEPVDEVARAVVREARLLSGGIVAGPVEALAELGPTAVSSFSESPCPVILLGTRGWDPAWSRAVPIVLDAPVPDQTALAALWSRSLGDALDGQAPQATSVATMVRLTPEQVVRAARASVQHAVACGRPVSAEDVHAGTRQQNAAGLQHLARRLVPSARWDDLVLPRNLTEQMHELLLRCTARDQTLRAGRGAGAATRRAGVTALFAGAPGTGKTLSAEVLATELGLDLYVVDLATVVDKYIGETEKNLDRIFAEAERVNGVLLFDEADALFSKRGDVRDSHDRYANLEVAYLLQLMERTQGLTVLTTNLRSNLDNAFIRRIDAVLDFGLPDADQRERLWHRQLGDEIGSQSDIDVAFLAGAFRLTGGEIRNICLTAAVLAAGADRAIVMTDVVLATEREYQKMGRLCVASEFGPYAPLLRAPHR